MIMALHADLWPDILTERRRIMIVSEEYMVLERLYFRLNGQVDSGKKTTNLVENGKGPEILYLNEITNMGGKLKF